MSLWFITKVFINSPRIILNYADKKRLLQELDFLVAQEVIKDAVQRTAPLGGLTNIKGDNLLITNEK